MQYKLFVCLLLFSQITRSQQFTTPTVNPIVALGDNSAIFTGPVLIDAQACFNLSNGVQTMEVQGSGYFNSSCLLISDVLDLKVRAFPNPVKNEFILKAEQRLKVGTTQEITVKIFDVSGKHFQSIKSNLSNLYDGLMIRMGNITNGIYTINLICGSMHIGSVKIFKVN